jgi:sigma-B regulation protein RsbU (phosphoserine phosphatase)
MVLEPGDLLVMYTDGLTEETNAEGEFFGERRLEETVQLSSQLPLEELRDRIFATLNDFGGPDQADDRTLMLMRTNLLP